MKRDAKTEWLLSHDVYSVNTKEELEAINQFRIREFWEGVKYTVTLSLMLWWIPIFGQAIAGYVGGRKAGTPLRGVIAALIPVDIILMINIMYRIVAFQTNVDVVGTAAVMSSGFTDVIPNLYPYFAVSISYVSSYFLALQSLIQLEPSMYLLVVTFAMIGGLMAEQGRRDLVAAGMRPAPVPININVSEKHEVKKDAPVKQDAPKLKTEKADKVSKAEARANKKALKAERKAMKRGFRAENKAEKLAKPEPTKLGTPVKGTKATSDLRL